MPEASGFGLYVHWPYCQAKCPYCDFNSHVSSQVDHESWAAAYGLEIERLGRETEGRTLDSIFFGGGTPSLMEPRVVDEVIATAQRVWRFANDIEITLEANPTSTEANSFLAFQSAGVNRASVGLQALNDLDLQRLGRRHSADEGLRAFEIARTVFPRASFDLIYARQHQSLQSWEDELKQALALGADHMSLYQLTIEPGTAFGDRFEKGKLGGLPDDELGADMFDLTQELCEAAGLSAYEISNHARAGAESRHNLIYWASGDWAGIGPGAHGRLTLNGQRVATETVRSPAKWIAGVQSDGSHEKRNRLTKEQIREEKLLMGLRLNEGVAVFDADISNKVFRINSLVENPIVTYRDDILRLTPKGRPLLNAILRELLV